MSGPLISTPMGVMFVLVAVAGFFFLLEQRSGWKIFTLFPPLLWICLALCSMAPVQGYAVEAPLHHELEVSLEPERQTLSVTDRITLPAASAEAMTLYLHTGLEPRASTALAAASMSASPSSSRPTTIASSRRLGLMSVAPLSTTGPSVPGGVTTRSCELETNETSFAGRPPMKTSAVGSNPDPRRTSDVPPFTEP